jgi:hypothetical protein
VLFCLQSTSGFACLVGPWTFDFAATGANSTFAKNAFLVIGRVLSVVPPLQGSDHEVTVEVLKAYTNDPRFIPSAKITVSALFTNCGQRVAVGQVGLYAIRGAGKHLELVSRL